MNFDQAFDALISHEGGYVWNERVKYVNDQTKSSHSRKLRSDVFSPSVCIRNAGTRCIINIFSAVQLAQLCVLNLWMRAPSLRSWTVQCALHQGPKNPSNGCSGEGEKARGLLLGMRQTNWRKGWLGAMPAPLQTSPLRDIKRRCNLRFWIEVRALWRSVSSRSIRLSSLRGKTFLSKRNVRQQVTKYVGCRAIKVHFVVRQLSPNGAQK